MYLITHCINLYVFLIKTIKSVRNLHRIPIFILLLCILKRLKTLLMLKFKTISTFLFLITTTVCYSQSDGLICNDLIKRRIDSPEYESYSLRKPLMVTNNVEQNAGFVLTLAKMENVIIINIGLIDDFYCINDVSVIDIFFEDGSIIRLKNENEFNCKGIFSTYLGDVYGKYDELEILKIKNIQKVTIFTTSVIIDQTFNKEQREIFRNSINCLSKY